MTADPTPQLWHFRVSHYNEKVRWALDRKRWAHRRTALIPGFHMRRVRRLSGQEKTPVLRLGERVLHDSTDIIAELERIRPDPPLYPADPEERARALAIEDFFDEEVAPDVRTLFWSAYIDDSADATRLATDGFGLARRVSYRLAFPFMRPVFRKVLGLDVAGIERAAARLPGHLDRLEAELERSSAGFLVGGAFSVADLTAAAVMTAILRPPEFPYPLPDPWPPRLVELRDGIAERAGSRWVMETYARHRDPSAEVA